MNQKIRDNLWRGWGVLALLYMVLWWVALFVWYFPFYGEAYQNNVPYIESVFAFLFVTAGTLVMVFSFFVVSWGFEK